MNKLIMKGVITKDIDFKVSASGTAFSRFSIAIKDAKANRTDYFNIVAFYDTAEEIANHFSKGSEIYFEGKLQNNNYEKDGKKVYSDRIILDKLLTIGDTILKGTETQASDDDLPF